MSWIDIVIVAVVLLAVWRGKSQGLVRQVAGWIGVIGGFIIGTMVASTLSYRITHATWRPLLAFGLLMAFCVGGSLAGKVVGSALHRSLRALKLGVFDSAGGIVFAVAGSVITCWLAGKVLSTVAWGSLATAVHHSALLKQIDKLMPSVPSFVNKAQTLLSNAHKLP